MNTPCSSHRRRTSRRKPRGCDHSGDALAVFGQRRGQRRGVAGLDLVALEQQRTVERVEQLDASDGDGPDRVAVVAARQADEVRAPPLAAGVVPLVGHLQRDLVRGRAAVGVEDAAQAVRRDLHQPPRQLDRRRVAEPQHRRVRNAVELRADRGVDPRMAVTVDVAPQ
jgi:hypothetical protein